MIKRLNIVVIVFSLLISMNFASCGDEKTDKSQKEKEKLVTDNKKNDKDDKKSKDNKIDLKGESIKLITWWDNAPSNDELLANSKAVEKKYNCKIEYLNIPFDQLIPKFTASVLSGEPIGDLVRMEAPRAVPVLVENNLLLPLTDLFDYSDPKYPSFLKDCSYYKGNYYGVTNEDNERGYFLYNIEMLNNLGYPDMYNLYKEGNWTWDKFLEIAKKATKDTDGDGSIDQWGFGVQSLNILTPFIMSNGGNIVTLENDKFVYGMNSPNALEAIKFINDLYKVHKVVLPIQDLLDWNAAKTEFSKEKVAMEYGWVWEIQDLEKSMHSKIGMLPVPKGPKMTEYVGPVENSQIDVMPKNAKHPKEVAKIIQDLYRFEKDASDHTSTIKWLKDIMTPQNLEVCKDILKKGRYTYYKAFPGVMDLNNILIRDYLFSQNMKVEDAVKITERDSIESIAKAFNK